MHALALRGITSKAQLNKQSACRCRWDKRSAASGRVLCSASMSPRDWLQSVQWDSVRVSMGKSLHVVVKDALWVHQRMLHTVTRAG